MGMQDRDYYRDWWKKKLDHVERAPFRLPAAPTPVRRDIGQWHPVLSILLFIAICSVTFLALWLFQTIP